VKTLFLLTSLLLLQQRPIGATIEGQVVRAGTTQALRESRILLTKVGGRLADSIVASTDADGRFAIANIPSGKWRVFADHDDYARAEYGQRNVTQPGSPVDLVEGQRLSNVTLALTPLGVMTGRITNREGLPVPRVFVRALKSTYAQGERKLTMFKETQSNDLGEYRLFGLTPGLYFVSAAPYRTPEIRDNAYIVPTAPGLDRFGEGWSQMTLGPRLNSGSPFHPFALTGEKYAEVFFPGTTDSQSARPVDVQPGAVVRGIDLNTVILSPVTGHRLTVQLVDASGQSVRNARWSITVAGYGITPSIRNGETATGGFEVQDLSPGRYNVSSAISVGTTVTMWGSKVIEVREGTFDDVRLVLTAPIVLPGRVIGMSASLKDASIVLRPPSGGGPPIQPDGSFSIVNVRPGDYELALTGAPPNFYISSVKLGNVDVTAGLQLASAPQQSLDVVISPNAGVVDGTVIDNAGQGASAVTVVLIPESPRRSRIDLYRVASSDTAGRFRLEGIVPGNYKVFLWESIEENSWQDPDVLRIYEDQGKPVRINDASRETIQLSIP
jgi:hypothetical protein